MFVEQPLTLQNLLIKLGIICISTNVPSCCNFCHNESKTLKTISIIQDITQIKTNIHWYVIFNENQIAMKFPLTCDKQLYQWMLKAMNTGTTYRYSLSTIFLILWWNCHLFSWSFLVNLWTIIWRYCTTEWTKYTYSVLIATLARITMCGWVLVRI